MPVFVIADNLDKCGDPGSAVITGTSSERPSSVKGRVREFMARAMVAIGATEYGSQNSAVPA